MQNRRENLNNNEIDELTEELAKLQIQVDTIQNRLKEIKERNQKATETTQNRNLQQENSNRPLRVGDQVSVTNRYKGRQGVTGIVVRLTQTQAVVRPENGEEEFRKYKANLRRV
jgi:predicted nuclease with TOPRIM domain